MTHGMATVTETVTALQPHESAFTVAPEPPRPVPVLADDAAALAAARALAADFAGTAAARDIDRALPFAEIERFTASGLWAITVPREYGGTGVTAATVAQVTAIIAAADGSLGQIPQNHFYALEVLRNGTRPCTRRVTRESPSRWRPGRGAAPNAGCARSRPGAGGAG